MGELYFKVLYNGYGKMHDMHVVWYMTGLILGLRPGSESHR